MLSCGQTMVFSFFMPQKKLQERKAMTISQIMEQISKKPLPEHTKFLTLEMCVNDRNDEDVEVPSVVMHL
jgi:ubiquitin-activating enzyme E1